MFYFLLILFAAACTLVGVWGYRIWEIVSRKRTSLLVRLSSPFLGVIILLSMVSIVLVAFISMVYHLLTLGWDKIRKLPYNAISIFISMAFILNSKFKLSPVIDNKSSAFWQWAVSELNIRRSAFQDSPAIDSMGKLLIRDPHSRPMRTVYRYSSWHPFMLQKSVCKMRDGVV